MSEYIMNKETGKIELHFDKSDYLSLPENLKAEIKSNFLFSRRSGAWISRCKFPNLYRAEEVAKKLGLSDGGKIGDTLSFAEQMERRAEKAEARADRYDYKSYRAEKRGDELQKPIHDMRGDIAFFTQPNINSAAGRAFTNKRQRMFDAYNQGFEEFKKSEYYAERAKAARETANQTKPTDRGFIDRRIKDAEKVIRAQNRNIEHYKTMLEDAESDNDTEKMEKINRWIETAEEIIEQSISKSVYYHECLEEVGGVQFSKENIKPGYVVFIKRWGKCKVLSTGKVNFVYKVVDLDRAGVTLKGTYAEIDKIVSTEIPDVPEYPYKVGERYTVDVWSDESCKYEPKEYEITKVTNGKVTLKSGTERAITRTPFDTWMGWAIRITGGHNGTIYKKA